MRGPSKYRRLLMPADGDLLDQLWTVAEALTELARRAELAAAGTERGRA